MQLFSKQTTNSRLIFFLLVILILGLGFLDYLTGDYSLDVFYLVAIFTVAYFVGVRYGLVCVIQSVIMEIISDYYVHTGNVFMWFYYWSWASDIVEFTMVCILAAFLRKLLVANESKVTNI